MNLTEIFFLKFIELILWFVVIDWISIFLVELIN